MKEMTMVGRVKEIYVLYKYKLEQVFTHICLNGKNMTIEEYELSNMCVKNYGGTFKVKIVSDTLIIQDTNENISQYNVEVSIC